MILRDFIYVDADRVYSLYSQVFEGVADKIIQTSTSTLGSSETVRGPVLSGKEAETRGDESLQKTESRVLYDHIYNQLEHRLGDNIASSREAFADPQIGPGRFVKISGGAEVEDYARLDKFLTHFNEMGEMIAFSISQSSGLNETVRSLEEAANTKKDRNQKVRAQAAAKSAGDRFVKSIARDKGLHQDKRLIDGLKLFTSIFNPAGFEVVITPPDTDGAIVARVVLNRRWLRMDADFLRTLHPGTAAANWTVVGHITHRPGSVNVPESQTESADSIRSRFRSMFQANRNVERLFFEDKDREEIVILPLAIYRESTLIDVGA